MFDDLDTACLEVQTEDGISLGKTVVKPPSYSANFKGGDWSPLERDGIDFVPGEGPELFVRLQFKAKKRKVRPSLMSTILLCVRRVGVPSPDRLSFENAARTGRVQDPTPGYLLS